MAISWFCEHSTLKLLFTFSKGNRLIDSFIDCLNRSKPELMEPPIIAASGASENIVNFMNSPKF